VHAIATKSLARDVESKNTESDEMRKEGGGMIRPNENDEVCEIARVGAIAPQDQKSRNKKECDGTVSSFVHHKMSNLSF
jgi:hypothetical protein